MVKRYGLLAWGVFALAALLSLIAIALMFVPLPGQPLDPANIVDQILTAGGGVMDALVGAVIATRIRKNPIGWLFLAAGLALAVGMALSNYVQIAFWSGGEMLPGGLGTAWGVEWVWQIPTLALILLLFLFPTGRFLSTRWRWIGGASAIMLVGEIALFAFSSPITVPTAGGGTLALTNPIALFVLSDPQSPLISLATVVPTLAALGSVLFRFVRAQGVERTQMKWVVYVGSLLAVGIAMSFFVTAPLFQILTALISLSLPVALGFAILRYRLYDIDIIIRRTLIYSVLTVLLAFVYFGSVILLQQLFRAVSGESSDIAIILSTLTIAALFNPLRHRVRTAIDHRFYRRKYDAQQVLARFAQTARDETDLDNLTARLIEVVEETMQPASVNVWLKKDSQ